MILLQLMSVLPAASHFVIYDMNKPVLEGSISNFDKTLMFTDFRDDINYQKDYSLRHVELVDKVDDIWLVNVT